MENKYRNLMNNIQVPAKLTDQVLTAARLETIASAKRAPMHRPLLWGTLSAMIALALFLSIPTYTAPVPTDSDPNQISAPLTLSFGLTAYAADSGEQYPASVNGSLAMNSGSGLYWAEQNSFFTGSLFQITGEDIKSIRLSLDRGGFYSYRVQSGLSSEQIQEIREAQERGEVAPAAIDQDLDGVWSFQEMIPLGNTVAIDYDPNIWYGLQIPDWEDRDGDMRTASQTAIDALDSGLMTVSVIFTNGTEQTNTYELHTGRLRIAANSNGIPLPELAGEDELYIYGVYATPVQ